MTRQGIERIDYSMVYLFSAPSKLLSRRVIRVKFYSWDALVQNVAVGKPSKKRTICTSVHDDALQRNVFWRYTCTIVYSVSPYCTAPFCILPICNRQLCTTLKYSSPTVTTSVAPLPLWAILRSHPMSTYCLRIAPS